MISFHILPDIHKSNLAYPCLSFVLPQGPSLINVTGWGKKRKKEKREKRKKGREKEREKESRESEKGKKSRKEGDTQKVVTSCNVK